MKILAIGCFLVIFSCSTQLFANETHTHLSLSVLTRIETYDDSPNRSVSAGVGLSLAWKNLDYDQNRELDTNYFELQFTYYKEQDAEQYDEDRNDASGEILLRLQRALFNPRRNTDSTLNFVGIYEAHYNSQQLEEFERLTVVGLALNNRLGAANNYDLGLTLGVAHNEEEKDDDLPRIFQEIDDDQLNRSGYGYYVEWNNQYNFTESKWRLSLDLSRYEGLWAYQDKPYAVDRIAVGFVVPFADRHSSLQFSSEYIIRKSEQDLIGFDDELSRTTIKYAYQF